MADRLTDQIWVTDESPPRRLFVKGRSAIDPDCLVAHLLDDTMGERPVRLQLSRRELTNGFEILRCYVEQTRLVSEHAEAGIAIAAEGSAILPCRVIVVPTEFLGRPANFAPGLHGPLEFCSSAALPFRRVAADGIVATPLPIRSRNKRHIWAALSTRRYASLAVDFRKPVGPGRRRNGEVNRSSPPHSHVTRIAVPARSALFAALRGGTNALRQLHNYG